MSTVIIPHLDLVINMIEKNIFRPLPILKKAGLPGEGVGMEEVLSTNKISNNFSWTPPGLTSNLCTNSSSNWSSMTARMSRPWKYTSLHRLSKSFWSCLTHNNPGRESTSRTFCIGCMLNLYPEEKWLERPLMTASIRWFMRLLSSMELRSCWIFWPVSSVGLPCLWERSISSFSRTS